MDYRFNKRVTQDKKKVFSSSSVLGLQGGGGLSVCVSPLLSLRASHQPRPLRSLRSVPCRPSFRFAPLFRFAHAPSARRRSAQSIALNRRFPLASLEPTITINSLTCESSKKKRRKSRKRITNYNASAGCFASSSANLSSRFA